MFLLELAALEAGGQLLTDGLLDDAGAGKADQRTGLGQHDVAQAGEAGRDTAGGRMGQVADVQPALGGEFLNGGAGLGHLHQAEDALLHAGAAAGGEDDQRQLFVGGVLDGAGDLLTHRGAHAAHEEVAVQNHNHNRHALNLAGGGDGRIRQAGLAGLLGQLFLVAGEFEGIVALQLLVQLTEGAVVQNQGQAVVTADGLIAPAVGADIHALGPGAAGCAALTAGAGDKHRRLPDRGKLAGFRCGLAGQRAGAADAEHI